MDEVVIDCSAGEEKRQPLTAEEERHRLSEAAEAEAGTSINEAEADADIGRRSQLMQLRSKALAVWAGDGTFTQAQSQKILAGLVLLELRDSP